MSRLYLGLEKHLRPKWKRLELLRLYQQLVSCALNRRSEDSFALSRHFTFDPMWRRSAREPSKIGVGGMARKYPKCAVANGYEKMPAYKIERRGRAALNIDAASKDANFARLHGCPGIISHSEAGHAATITQINSIYSTKQFGVAHIEKPTLVLNGERKRKWS